MAKWSYWDWIGYVVLALAAFGMAFGGVLKDNVEVLAMVPSILVSPRWAYVPAILFTIGSVILLARAFAPTPPVQPAVIAREVSTRPTEGAPSLKDMMVWLEGSSMDPTLVLTATPIANTSLSVFVEHSNNRGAFGQWSQRQRAFIQDVKVYKNQAIRIPLFVRAEIPGNDSDLWWGPPNEGHGNGVLRGLTLASLVFLDPQGKEAYLSFLIAQTKLSDPRFYLIDDLDYIKKWHSD